MAAKKTTKKAVKKAPVKKAASKKRRVTLKVGAVPKALKPSARNMGLSIAPKAPEASKAKVTGKTPPKAKKAPAKRLPKSKASPVSKNTNTGLNVISKAQAAPKAKAKVSTQGFTRKSQPAIGAKAPVPRLTYQPKAAPKAAPKTTSSRQESFSAVANLPSSPTQKVRNAIGYAKNTQKPANKKTPLVFNRVKTRSVDNPGSYQSKQGALTHQGVNYQAGAKKAGSKYTLYRAKKGVLTKI